MSSTAGFFYHPRWSETPFLHSYTNTQKRERKSSQFFYKGQCFLSFSLFEGNGGIKNDKPTLQSPAVQTIYPSSLHRSQQILIFADGWVFWGAGYEETCVRDWRDREIAIYCTSLYTAAKDSRITVLLSKQERRKMRNITDIHRLPKCNYHWATRSRNKHEWSSPPNFQVYCEILYTR